MTFNNLMKNDDWKNFIQLIKEMESKNEGNILAELLETMDTTSVHHLWTGLKNWFQMLENKIISEPTNIISNIKSACFLIKVFISCGLNKIPDDLVHLIDLFCEFAKLTLNFESKNDTFFVELLSQIHDLTLNHRIQFTDSLKVNSIKYLLDKCCINPKAYKFLTNYKDLVMDIDVNVLNTELIRFTSPMSINNKQGQEFISLLLTLDYHLSMEIHNQLKICITTIGKLKVCNIAVIYYKAWTMVMKENNVETIKTIENEMLQDIIKLGYLMKNSEEVHKVLTYFHEQMLKNEAFTATMCLLYSPFFYRYAKSTNYLVRRNAAKILCNVFPLIDKNLNKVDLEESISNQLILIEGLLDDPSPKVGAVAVNCILNSMAISLRWYPFTVQKKILTKKKKVPTATLR